jgi:Holliday junction DNA helicase RuvA
MNDLPVIGDVIKVHTFLYIREDIMMLYGFLEKDEMEMFKQLISVSGIGPKGAIGILSALSADDLRFAILSGDSKAIAKAPGIGAKTASRVCLELKDKISLEEAFEQKLEHTAKGGAENGAKASENSIKNDAVMALTALGYSSTESLKAVSKVEITEEMDVEDILRAALKHMALF